jgi:para-nitrobenzyl esterase
MGVVVETAAGAVEGDALDGVHGFRGIPYARAARFELPGPVAPWPGVRDATRFGPAAPQLPDPTGGVPGSPVGPTDEDCLSLNVWAPAGAAAGGARPVMVWFHGGAFVLGASSQPVHDGARLAREQDVVVVSANYRLGALGFLDTRPIGGSTANLGLHDALAALAWVRDNVAAFGGDPARVTVFGVSAGGGVVLHLLASPARRGLFHRAIVQSGATGRTLRAAQAELVARAMCDALGVRDVDRLRAAPADAIVRAQPSVGAAVMRAVGVMPFHPCVDGALLDDVPAAALARGVGRGVPLLAGATLEEMALYVEVSGPPADRDALVHKVARYLHVDEVRARAVVETYEADLGRSASAEPSAVWLAVFSDVEMQVPLRAVLDAHAPHAPTYAYLFAWRAPGVGAAPAVDVPFTFGTFVDGWGEWVGAGVDAERLSSAYRGALASFARDGDPGWPPHPAARVFDRESRVAPAHPLFARQGALQGP